MSPADRAEVRRLRARARDYRADAESLYRQIQRLDRSDPESRDAARVWSDQAQHASEMADEADRYAMRLTG